MSYYTLKAIDDLIATYGSKGGVCTTVQEGALGYGVTILQGPGLKMAVIHEHYINKWSSGHTIRLYNKPPRKYVDMLEKVATQ